MSRIDVLFFCGVFGGILIGIGLGMGNVGKSINSWADESELSSQSIVIADKVWYSDSMKVNGQLGKFFGSDGDYRFIPYKVEKKPKQDWQNVAEESHAKHVKFMMLCKDFDNFQMQVEMITDRLRYCDHDERDSLMRRFKEIQGYQKRIITEEKAIYK